MTEEHPNVALLKRFNPADVAGNPDIFAEDVVFHYFNPELPDMQGDYLGRAGLQAFFGKMAQQTGGSFEVNPISVVPFGDELLVAHVRNTMTMGDRKIEVEAVVVWRIVDGQISEVWDIPAVHSARTSHVED